MNAATETSESFVAPTTASRPVRPFYWSVMRELWENRSLFIAPLVAAGVLLIAVAISLIANASQLSQGMQALSALTPEKQQMMIAGSSRSPFSLSSKRRVDAEERLFAAQHHQRVADAR